MKRIVSCLFLVLLAAHVTEQQRFKSWGRNLKKISFKRKSFQKVTTWRRLLGPDYRTNQEYTFTEMARMLFPGYFRTKCEQRRLYAKYRQHITTVGIMAEPCLWLEACNNTEYECPARRKRSVSTWYHGCVESSQTHKVINWATNLGGAAVEVVQEPGAYQYFVEEDMKITSGCTICSGHQPEPFIHAAVVWVNKTAPDPVDQIDIDHILTKGCSKCLNALPTRRN